MMLQVTPFSRWERELPKLITDARYQAVPTLRERRQIFDDYCKSRAERHNRGKAEKARGVREGFVALMTEAASTSRAPDGESLPRVLIRVGCWS